MLEPSFNVIKLQGKLSMSSSDCPHCKRVHLAIEGRLPAFVHETERLIVIAGDHQFFEGYCIAIAKIHVREMHRLPRNDAMLLFGDVLDAGRRIDLEFKPLKMNYASLGNLDEHLHWHIIPRYENDPDHKDHPWKNAAHFSSKPTTKADIMHIRSIFNSTTQKKY
jgi:diadenosine tetraphosphate (Ap4A) HIT family hydrolase